MSGVVATLLTFEGSFSLPLMVGLIILAPRILEIVRIPMPLSALALGMLWAPYYLDPNAGAGPSLDIIATVAITMLFLFAGLEVDMRRIRQDWRSYTVLGGSHLVVVALVGFVCLKLFLLTSKEALILAVGLVTPSAGYILDSLGKMRLTGGEKQGVSNGAIGLEISSLIALAVILRMDAPMELLLMAVGIGFAFFLLPIAWRALGRGFFSRVPRAEFVSMFMLAMVLAHISKALGLYYIFGAFMTGMILGKINQEKVRPETRDYVMAVELITALFIPVYFFRAGAVIPLESLSLLSLGIGTGFTLVFFLRIAPVILSRRPITKVSSRSSAKIALALAPTLVFGLVIADILHKQTDIPKWLVGALIVHTLLITILPVIVLRGEVTEMDIYHEARSSTVSGVIPLPPGV
ncbi:hypothetical protein BH09SUM1_BH09SUM1_28260 [soil metagenome]